MPFGSCVNLDKLPCLQIESCHFSGTILQLELEVSVHVITLAWHTLLTESEFQDHLSSVFSMSSLVTFCLCPFSFLMFLKTWLHNYLPLGRLYSFLPCFSQDDFLLWPLLCSLHLFKYNRFLLFCTSASASYNLAYLLTNLLEKPFSWLSPWPNTSTGIYAPSAFTSVIDIMFFFLKIQVPSKPFFMPFNVSLHLIYQKN